MIQRPTTTPAFILAGGEGQRLAPLTEAKPKPAVPFGGTHQILDFTLSNCVNSGLRRIYVLTQHMREPLHDYIRQSRLRLSGNLQWSDGDELRCAPPVSGKRYRGTADAVFQNLPLIRFDSADHVLIASGDHIYSADYHSRISRHAVVETSAIRSSVVSDGACIESGAIVENSVVLPGTRVSAKARVRNAIVTECATVPSGCRVGEDPRADRDRFLMTPQGVVVVTANTGVWRERSIACSVRQQAVAAA